MDAAGVKLADQHHGLRVVVVGEFPQPAPSSLVECAFERRMQQKPRVLHLGVDAAACCRHEVRLGAVQILGHALALHMQPSEHQLRLNVVQRRGPLQQGNALFLLGRAVEAAPIHPAEVQHRFVQAGLDRGEKLALDRRQPSAALFVAAAPRPFGIQLGQTQPGQRVAGPRGLPQPALAIVAAAAMEEVEADGGGRGAIAANRQQVDERPSAEGVAEAGAGAGLVPVEGERRRGVRFHGGRQHREMQQEKGR